MQPHEVLHTRLALTCAPRNPGWVARTCGSPTSAPAHRHRAPRICLRRPREHHGPLSEQGTGMQRDPQREAAPRLLSQKPSQSLETTLLK